MKIPRSLRFRILAVTIPTLLLASALNLYVISRMFENSVTWQYDLRLRDYFDHLVSQIQSGKDAAAIQKSLSAGDFSNLFWLVRGENGNTTQSSALTLPSSAVLPAPEEINDIRVQNVRSATNHHLRVFVSRITGPDNSIVSIAVGSDRHVLDQQVKLFGQSVRFFLAGLLLVAFLTGLLQFLVIQQVVKKLQRGIEMLRSGDSTRLSGRFPSELEPLISNLNTLIKRNEDIVANARMQATNLAHTIKTPLAIIKNKVNELSHTDSDLDVSELNANLEQIDRMSRFYLARARTTNSLAPGPAVRKIRVRPIIFEIVEAIRRLHQDKPLTISYQCADGATFAGDATDLEEILGALLDNAAKWADGSVNLDCTVQADKLNLVITDDGPGIPAAHRSEIAKPGVRLDDTVQGTGHGLSIVVEIVRSYGGTFNLGDARPQGLRVFVSLPAATGDPSAKQGS